MDGKSEENRMPISNPATSRCDKNTNFDINVELPNNRTVDRRTDEHKSRRLSRKVRRSVRCFMQGLMVV